MSESQMKQFVDELFVAGMSSEYIATKSVHAFSGVCTEQFIKRYITLKEHEGELQDFVKRRLPKDHWSGYDDWSYFNEDIDVRFWREDDEVIHATAYFVTVHGMCDTSSQLLIV